MIPGQGTKSLHILGPTALGAAKNTKAANMQTTLCVHYRACAMHKHTNARLYFSGYKIRYALGCLMKTELTGLTDGLEAGIRRQQNQK